jgi:hypothetical protein
VIEIKVTGDNAGEVLNHLAQLTNGLLAGAAQSAIAAANVQPAPAHDPVMPEVAEAQSEADKPKRTRRTREQIAADEAAAKAAEGNDATGAPDVQEHTDSSSDQSAISTTQTESPQPNASDDAPALLDFDKDVAPKVLSLVKSRGKPWVVDILAQFGVERASELPPERFGELLTALEDADAA